VTGVQTVLFRSICETVRAYSRANALVLSGSFELSLCLIYAAGELLQFYVVVRLAYAVVRKSPSRTTRRVHLAALLLYAGATTILRLTHSPLVITHVVLGAAHLWAITVVIIYRARIRDPRLLRFTDHLIVASLVFAPSIGLSVYTGYAESLLFGDMTLQILYAIVVEIIIAVHVVTAYSVPWGTSAAGRPASTPADVPDLSKREWDIVQLVSKGYTNKEIGDILSISRKTVTNHLYHVYKKVDVKNRVQLLSEVDSALRDQAE